MKTRIAALFVLFTAIAAMSLAHGNKKHVMGIVESVSAGEMVVKQADGSSVTVKLVAGTTYVRKDGAAAKLSDVSVGNRVAIHATPKGATLEADEVKFSPAGATPAAAKPKS